MKKMNFTATILRFAFLALGLVSMVAAANAQTTVVTLCKEKVTLPMNRLNCTARLFESHFDGSMKPGTDVTIRKPGVGDIYTGKLFANQAAYDVAAAACNCSEPAGFFKGFSYPNNLGLEFVVMYTNNDNTMCFTAVNIRDEAAPIFVNDNSAGSPAIVINQTIRCTEILNGKAPAPGSVIKGNTLSDTRMPEPFRWKGETGITQTSCWTPAPSDKITGWPMRDCHNYSVCYEDVVTEYNRCILNCDEGISYGPDILTQPKTIERRFTFKDKWGNTTPAGEMGTVQIITVVYPVIRLGDGTDGKDLTACTIPRLPIINGVPSCPQTITQDEKCTKTAASAGLPYIDWDCNGSRNADGKEDVLTDGTDYCGTSILLVDNSTPMKLCPNTSMYTRNYKVRTCAGFYSFAHVITLVDKTGPAAKVEYSDFSRTPVEQCVYMGSMKISQYVYSTLKEVRTTDIKGSANVDYPGTTVHSGVIKITPLMKVGTCSTVDVDFTIKATDGCGGDVTLRAGGVDGSGIRFDGMPQMTVTGGSAVRVTGTLISPDVDANGVPLTANADKSFTVVMTDVCGNTTEFKVIVVIIDNLSPNSYCSGKDVTLTNSGEAVITPEIIAMNPYDNCALRLPISRLIRRTGTDCWSTQLILNCTDIGELKVDVRTLDMMNNYNDCCVTIKVLDKQGPQCVMAPDVVKDCTDPKLADIEALFTQPQAYDNCETPKVSSDPAVVSISCGKGTGAENVAATKTWTFTDKAGNSTSCFQRLIINPISGYRVKPLLSEVKTCSYTFDEVQERKNALAALKLFRNVTNPTTQVVTKDVPTCSGPVVEVESWEYSSSEFCKIYKIRYTFQDICRFPTISSTTIPCVIRKEFKEGTKVLITEENIGCYGGVVATSGDFKDYYQADDATGTFSFERFVYVRDNKAPISKVPTVSEICVVDNSCKFDFPKLKLTGSDLCDDGSTTDSNLYFDWSIVISKKADGSDDKIVSGSTADIDPSVKTDLKGLKFGTYTVKYTVKDGCGNVNWYQFTVTGKDCKAPYINTHDKNTALAYTNTVGQGMSIVKVAEVLNAVADNCTSEAFLLSKLKYVRASGNPTNTYPEAAGTEIMFTCADAGQTIATQVWTKDEAGNTNFNVIYITVEDNAHACSGAVAQSVIAGGLKTENNQAAAKVTLTASANGTVANTIATDANGDFSFNVAQGGNYVVKAAKLTTEDKYAGVTTFDIARISKHLLGIENFNSAYQVLAADVDKSGDVDGADMLHIRNFILRKTTSLPGGVWRFIDKSYSFKNAANPFGEDFPEVVSLNGAKANETANFVSVKLGDVNNTYAANLVSTVVRNSKSLTLNVEDRNLVAGNEYTVNVTADEFNASAFQGTFNVANATVKSVKAGDLANYSDNNFGMFGNAITTSWNGAASKAANVFAITFTANKAGKLSDILTVGSNLTTAVANDAQGNEMNINLKFSTGKVAGAEFALYQNTPNPVATETSIGFNLPTEGAAKLTIYSVEGKVVLTKNIDAKAGLNSVSINKSELSANGVLYYRLETADFSATKKMIIIE